MASKIDKPSDDNVGRTSDQQPDGTAVNKRIRRPTQHFVARPSKQGVGVEEGDVMFLAGQDFSDDDLDTHGCLEGGREDDITADSRQSTVRKGSEDYAVSDSKFGEKEMEKNDISSSTAVKPIQPGADAPVGKSDRNCKNDELMGPTTVTTISIADERPKKEKNIDTDEGNLATTAAEAMSSSKEEEKSTDSQEDEVANVQNEAKCKGDRPCDAEAVQNEAKCNHDGSSVDNLTEVKKEVSIVKQLTCRDFDQYDNISGVQSANSMDDSEAVQNEAKCNHDDSRVSHSTEETKVVQIQYEISGVQSANRMDNSDMKQSDKALCNTGIETTNNSSTTNQDASIEEASREPFQVINLVPSQEDTSMISAYNNLLVGNIEFFHLSSDDPKTLGSSKNRDNHLGLRCIHCKTHTDAYVETEFPDGVRSIASVIETFGSRHLCRKKCPSIAKDVLEHIIDTKKICSNTDTGRISLEQYCKDIAAKYGISAVGEGRLCWIDNKLFESIPPRQPQIAESPHVGKKKRQKRRRKSSVKDAVIISGDNDDDDSVEIIKPSSKRKSGKRNAKKISSGASKTSKVEKKRISNRKKKSVKQDSFASLGDDGTEEVMDAPTRKRSKKTSGDYDDSIEITKPGSKRQLGKRNAEVMSSAASKTSKVVKKTHSNLKKKSAKQDSFVSLGDNDTEEMTDAPTRKRSRKNVTSEDSAVAAKDSESLTMTKGDKISKMKGIDSRVLHCLPHQPRDLQYYHEESSYRFHNPPFPDGGEQLAVVRTFHEHHTANWNMAPVEDSKLSSLPCPPPLPPLPKSGHCEWTFDEATRVLLADFKTASATHGKIVITPEDEQFLMTMMERDDITVISEGIAADVDMSLLGRDYVSSCIGSQYHYKVKEFRKTASVRKGSNFTGEVNGMYCEEMQWHSMRFRDYLDYLEYFQKTKENGDKMFTFTNSEGNKVEIDTSKVVLYLLDLDMIKMLPRAYENFAASFKLPKILPGGAHCMMNSINLNGRPFMGPNIYMTPPSSFTQFHQDGHGTVDSGHLCCRGYNEVVMLRRLPERHKSHALHLLTGTKSSGSSFLYGKPHDMEKTPTWPTVSAIERCKEMGYCPSVFILKPGQLVHINKGRLHAFRKVSHSPLHESDCHHALRKVLLPLIQNEDLTCLSVAWDWMFRGVTSNGINREVSSILECARLNQNKKVQSLAIPETSLLFLARDHLALLRRICAHNGEEMKLVSKSILKGILPSLQYVVHRHKKMTEEASTMWSKGGKHVKVSIDPKPNAWQNPDQFSMDPHGSGDFICKFCSDELSNLYMHCDGCERLLNKDFNICTSCHSSKVYKQTIQMHPFNPKRKSTLNHTGNMTQLRRTHCPCKNGPRCDTCFYCIGCSCTCHQQFTLQYRFMPVEEECELLKEVEEAVGADCLPDSLETKVKLFSLLPDDFQVPIDAFANDGLCSGQNATHGNQDDPAIQAQTCRVDYV